MKKPKGPRGFNSTLPARTKGLPRGKGPRGKPSTKRKPGKRLPRENAKRQAKRRAEGKVRGPHSRWVAQEFPCELAKDPRHTCWGPVDPHHDDSVGSGGDDRSCVPLCRGAHNASPLSVHVMGVKTFQKYWSIDLAARAAYYWSISPHNPASRPTFEEFAHDLVESISRGLGVPVNVLTGDPAPRPVSDGSGAHSTKEVSPHEVGERGSITERLPSTPAGGRHEAVGGVGEGESVPPTTARSI